MLSLPLVPCGIRSSITSERFPAVTCRFIHVFGEISDRKRRFVKLKSFKSAFSFVGLTAEGKESARGTSETMVRRMDSRIMIRSDTGYAIFVTIKID